MVNTRSLTRAQTIVRIASRLVPPHAREEWLKEWQGEIASVDNARTPIVRYACGSFADAFWIRQRDVADLQTIDDLRHGFRQWRQQAGFAITAIGILSLSMAASVVAFRGRAVVYRDR